MKLLAVMSLLNAMAYILGFPSFIWIPIIFITIGVLLSFGCGKLLKKLDKALEDSK